MATVNGACRLLLAAPLLGLRLWRRVFGYRVRWFELLLFRFGSVPPGFGLNDLDWRAIDLIDTAPGFYVEIGANDGVAQSNTLLLELMFGWRGLLIEPVESTFLRLKRNRSALRNRLVRGACISAHNQSSTVDLLYSNLMSIGIDLESDIVDPEFHASTGAKFLEPGDLVRLESVPALTLSAALDLAKAPRTVDFLSLDVEGAELEVLQGIDFGRYTIRWILVEARDFGRIEAFMKRHDYELVAKLSIHDYLFSLAEPA
jgi:FkbM family methyltransferase